MKKSNFELFNEVIVAYKTELNKCCRNRDLYWPNKFYFEYRQINKTHVAAFYFVDSKECVFIFYYKETDRAEIMYGKDFKSTSRVLEKITFEEFKKELDKVVAEVSKLRTDEAQYG